MTSPQLIIPDWPAPASVKAYTTTRIGGFSLPPFVNFNLAHHVGDDATTVDRNRALLVEVTKMPTKPLWLSQVHGINAVEITATQLPHNVAADAIYTSVAGKVCSILTADCLPVFLCTRQGDRVAVIHAGWRGLAAGVIEATVDKLNVLGKELLAWLGPAIGPEVFEVGEEVREQFIKVDAEAAAAFQPNARGRWLADIYLLARQRLARCGIDAVYGGDFCTYSDEQRFFSYRRDGQKTGRMASVIWSEIT